ncbi:Para-aminobenzoate synthase, aminase component [Mariniradius saccharolyticus AK6]|uniref:Para-aminobenzoate synthase, aminase component n=1 Tax=Mariniradius saccharolyticus AK6 TaxID=1239962 RepID=M7Y8P0_9BACT|nr:Para-aminobenzoate synthase, aminase component [Mariniradius saccharolyticus AK6]
MVGYDYKNKIEALKSENPAMIACPDYVFWEAELSISWEEGILVFSHPEASMLATDFERFSEVLPDKNPRVEVLGLESKETYSEKVKAIQQHIVEGDIYELNFCQAFHFQQYSWNPILGFLDLMRISLMPFSAFYKANNLYLLVASPERFLKKTGRRLIAQPIKGTIRRGKNEAEDEMLRLRLFDSEKERAENLMIVDLMRNDLSKVSEIGTVDVDELFGVYAFPKVHQMISTVSSTLRENVSLKDIFHANFPMGSMTGAPKIKCMELIERYENFKRGWFSGTLGVVQPNGDFDFNVIIRSIVFDKSIGKGYFAVGSAITYDADPAYEYEECLLKASAILEVLTRQR